MSYELERKAIGDHIYFNSVSDPKFKHNRLSVHFVLPLAEETASDNAVVPHILRKSCREWPDFTALNARLAELYGAVLDADVSKYAAYQVLHISVRALDNRFALAGEDLAAQSAHLLAAIVLDPHFDDTGGFAAADVALEKQYVIDTIESEINDKRTYALHRCLEEMCKGEPVAVHRYGSLDTARRITPDSATAAYRRMLKTAAVEIFFTGSGDPAGAEQVFTERFQQLERQSFDYQPVQLRTVAEQVTEQVERMDVLQGKMVMGMRTGGVETVPEINAMRVFSALYGGTPFSKLFLHVRERLSLCYYCASRFLTSSRLLLVDSGVDPANKQQAQDEIMAQLRAVQNGEIAEEELRNTKLLLKNSITSVTDSLSGIENWYMAQILEGRATTPAQDVQNLDAVTREQVVAAAKNVTLDTVYFLTTNTAEKEDAPHA